MREDVESKDARETNLLLMNNVGKMQIQQEFKGFLAGVGSQRIPIGFVSDGRLFIQQEQPQYHQVGSSLGNTYQ